MNNPTIVINPVLNPTKKEHIVKEVLADLPEWFGLPESTEEYILQARDLPLWVAQEDEKILRFITFKKTSESTCEIHCMGVKKANHGEGIGKRLFKAFETFSKEKYEYIQVKTVDEGHYKEYDQTISFYQSLGFKKLEVFPTLWDEWNPCLILIKKTP